MCKLTLTGDAASCKCDAIAARIQNQANCYGHVAGLAEQIADSLMKWKRMTAPQPGSE